MTLKKRQRIIPAAALAALVLILGGCAIAGVDTRDRIEMFAATLNSADRSTMNANFDQARTVNLPTMDATWWSTNFPVPSSTDYNYGVTLLDYSNPSNVVATIRGPQAFNAITGLPRNAVLVMSREGLDWYIEQVYLDGSAVALIK